MGGWGGGGWNLIYFLGLQSGHLHANKHCMSLLASLTAITVLVAACRSWFKLTRFRTTRPRALIGINTLFSFLKEVNNLLVLEFLLKF